jgi:hypothetical protein
MNRSTLCPQLANDPEGQIAPRSYLLVHALLSGVATRLRKILERLVVDVIDPTAADASVCDRRGIAAGNQPGNEIAAVLPKGDTRERAVLTLKKAAGRAMTSPGAGLTVGQAERT